MNFEIAAPGRILFGAGKLSQTGGLAAELGWRALVVVGVDLEHAQPLLGTLAAAQVVATLFFIEGEPSLQVVEEGVARGRAENCDLVIGFGGGSALDTAKAIAAMLANPGELLDYLEVVGRGQTLRQPCLPCIAIPTTAGTGSEVTRNAVLSVPEQQVKVSLRSPWMIPRLALVDPELTYSLPPAVTASTGGDALTQLIEPYLCPRANPFTDGLCREGMARAARSLRQAVFHGDDTQAREDMAIASLFGGLALANAGLGAVHGFAAPLGGMFPAPHGAICARLLPLVFEANWRALSQREPGNPILARFDEVARILTGKIDAKAPDGAAWLGTLIADLGIPSLSAYGISEAHIPAIVEKAAQASSMKANPVKLSEEELAFILAQAL